MNRKIDRAIIDGASDGFVKVHLRRGGNRGGRPARPPTSEGTPGRGRSSGHMPCAIPGEVLGIDVSGVLDALHDLSAGVVSFARGLNDTPKIAALLLVVPAIDDPAPGAANRRIVATIATSWLPTLPVSAGLAAAAYRRPA